MLPPSTLCRVGQVGTCQLFGGICYLLPSSGWKIKARGISRPQRIYQTTRLHFPTDFTIQEQNIHGLWPLVDKKRVKWVSWGYWSWRNRVCGVRWFKLPQKKHYSVGVTFWQYQRESLNFKRYHGCSQGGGMMTDRKGRGIFMSSFFLFPAV